MNPQDELLEIIDAYLSKSMSEEARIAFEKRIDGDNALAAQVDEVKATNEAIYYASLAALKSTIGADIKKITYKPAFDWKKAAYISIACVLLTAAVTAYFLQEGKKEEAIRKVSGERMGTESVTKPIQETRTSFSNTSTVPKLPEETVRIQENNQPVIRAGNTDITDPSLQGNNTRTGGETKPLISENILPEHTGDAGTKKPLTQTNSDPVMPCNKSFQVTTEASCKHKETGSISIETDGAYPYTFQAGNNSRTGTSAFFSGLAAGNYELLVTYEKACAYAKTVTVAEKWCSLNAAFSFNPDYHETWVMQYETGASGRYIIYDRSGKEIYSGIFGNANEYWDGSDIHGGTAPIGVYLAVLTYTDGRQEKVQLTIVR